MDTKRTNVEYVTRAPENVTYDEKVIRKLVNEALIGVDGLLGPKDGVFSGITDSFRHVEDVEIAKGLSITHDEGDTIGVKLEIITEMGSSMPDVINEVTERITQALHKQAGLKVIEVDVEVTDTMSREAYESKFRKPKE